MSQKEKEKKTEEECENYFWTQYLNTWIPDTALYIFILSGWRSEEEEEVGWLNEWLVIFTE